MKEQNGYISTIKIIVPAMFQVPKGRKRFFCFGINPSTATPDKLDPTVRKVQSIAKHNGYDSFMMLNVYPKRDTNFENLEETINDAAHLKNVDIIKEIISAYSALDIWVAFGDHIYDRKYLSVCFKDIYSKLPQKNIRWFATSVNKSGAPKHPLYQKNTAKLVDFNMTDYIETL